MSTKFASQLEAGDVIAFGLMDATVTDVLHIEHTDIYRVEFEDGYRVDYPADAEVELSEDGQ